MFAFDPYSPAVDADPFPHYKLLRDEHPCYWSKDANMWVLSRYADIAGALSDWHTYSSARGNLMDELPDRAGATLGTTDPPRHDQTAGTHPASLHQTQPRESRATGADIGG